MFVEIPLCSRDDGGKSTARKDVSLAEIIRICDIYDPRVFVQRERAGPFVNILNDNREMRRT